MKKLIPSLLISSAIILLSGCSEDNMGGDSAASGEKKIKYWVAPMDPTYQRDEPGKSPMGMDLVAVYEEEEESGEKKILYWVAPMDAAYRRDGPGKSPMGMDLIPVYDEGDGLSVKISPAVENNMGVRTAVAEYNKLWRRVDTVGYVDFDENKITHIHLRTKGWIEKLLVKSEGERVKKGQLLFEVYSPELVTAQEEYLQALGTSNRRLITASTERLIALGVSNKQISSLKKSRRIKQYVQVYASQDGIIDNLNVREGMFVMPNKRVMSLADLSSVWILAEVFEKQADWVKEGQGAEVRLSYLPGRTWKGTVEYIYPSLNPKTRTLKVRLRFDNADESLKPNMFAKVTIYAQPKSGIIVIPREAVIRATQNRVILSLGKGRFLPREVVIGIESGDWIEISHGLDEGDVVVTSGQFLLDSEASLKASMKRMTAVPEKKMEGMSEKSEGAKEVRGIIQSVMADHKMVNIKHDPVPELEWPAMTMDFKVADDVDLNSLKADDKIFFDIDKMGDDFVITSIIKHDEMRGN
ncbi:Cobalt/zinc/cadmium efflux RND transporter, membrane fusion protein, CzcB family [hydrothermal vent metagenome]|uniref:Cobalt/zinc/cadmium efflux RND transporter, membrane fusion protein, CzcB family n=1 Tax=hydrothermal vent metagenome TaxID=652676 RepID=A0A3B0ZZZ3_9ZZZZ